MTQTTVAPTTAPHGASREAYHAKVIRGGTVEADHTAYAIAIDHEGQTTFEVGNGAHVTTMRSAAKPLQAIPLVSHAGFAALQMRDEELAICCASHPGSPRHAALAASVLSLSGLLPDDLVCGPAGNPPAHIVHGCSGNHACILATAHLLGASLQGYEQIEHPAEQAILQSLREMAGCSDIPTPIDGCGVPTFSLSLRHMAIAFGALTQPEAPWSRLPIAMGRHPEVVGPEARIDVRVMRATGGRITAKTGAEGLVCFGTAGSGLAVKVLDGFHRPLAAFAVRALKDAGWLHPEELDLLADLVTPVMRCPDGRVAGRIDIS